MIDLWEGYGVAPDREWEDGDINLSQTTVNNAQLCGGKVIYKDHPGYESTPSQAMSWGSMMHGMNEEDLKSMVAGRAMLVWSARAVEAIWTDGLLNERDGSFDLYGLASRRDIDKWVAEAMHASELWHAQVVPRLDLSDDLLIEQRVTKCLGVLPDGRAVWFGGTADLVDNGNPLIIDWKTSGRAWHQSKADAGNQASYYTWLYGINEHAYWVYSRSGREWELFETIRLPEQVEAAKRLAWQTAKAIAGGSLIVAPWASTFGKYKRAWYCSARWCAAWDVCEFKSINDNVYEAQAINIKEGW